MRGNGKAAKQAVAGGVLSGFVKPKETAGHDHDARGYVDWGELPPNLLSGAIVSVNREGGSLLFGHTRDKSSYSVVVFYGGDKASYYFRCSEEGLYDLQVFLMSLNELDGLAESRVEGA